VVTGCDIDCHLFMFASAMSGIVADYRRRIELATERSNL